MTFQNINIGRVARSVSIILAISIGLSFLTSCLMLPLLSSDLVDRFSTLVDMFGKSGTTSEELNNELTSITKDFGPELTAQYAVQWALALLVTFTFARRTAQHAESPEQAMGYGLAIGLGTLFTYGLFCVMCSVAYFTVRLVFFGLIIGAGVLAGRSAGRNLSPELAGAAGFGPDPGTGFGPAGRGQAALPGAGGRGAQANPDVFYNMGVQAALGGRREEAREHFKRVLQLSPRHVPAWLQLANLADTPEDAWNYILQARLISPNDAAVQQAADLIWPKVSANAQRQSPPRNQPPYPGATPDDPDIPRTRLPGSEAPTLADLPAPDSTTEPPDAAGESDQSGDEPPTQP